MKNCILYPNIHWKKLLNVDFGRDLKEDLSAVDGKEHQTRHYHFVLHF